MRAETDVGLLDPSAPIVLHTELRRFPALQVFVRVCSACTWVAFILLCSLALPL